MSARASSSSSTFRAADDAAARNQLKDMCEKLLANTVIENYNIEIR